MNDVDDANISDIVFLDWEIVESLSWVQRSLLHDWLHPDNIGNHFDDEQELRQEDLIVKLENILFDICWKMFHFILGDIDLGFRVIWAHKDI